MSRARALPSRSGSDASVRTPPPARGAEGRPGRRLLWIAAVAAGLLLMSSLLAFGLGRDPNFVPSALIGRSAPDFTLRTLDGSRTVQLSDLRGQVVVVNFWASWCAECRAEAPALEAAWQRYRDQGVVVLGVSFQDTTASALAAAGELGKTYPLLSDPGSSTGLAYGLFGVPETFFVDPGGNVVAKQMGGVSYDLLSERINAMRAGSST